MVIIGAKGLASEILQIITLNKEFKDETIVFFDNVNKLSPDFIFNKFIVLKSFKEVETYFKTTNDNRFILGLGNPKVRFNLYNKFVNLGGVPLSLISKKSELGTYNVNVKLCTTIMSNVIISNNTSIGVGCLIYYNSVITHDCKIGDFVEISPSVTVLGRCVVGNFTSIGGNTTILPDVVIGKNVTIGAGSVITSNIPDNSVVVGVPGKIIKKNE